MMSPADHRWSRPGQVTTVRGEGEGRRTGAAGEVD